MCLTRYLPCCLDKEALLEGNCVLQVVAASFPLGTDEVASRNPKENIKSTPKLRRQRKHLAVYATGGTPICRQAVLLCSAALGLPSKEPWLAGPVFTVSGRHVGSRQRGLGNEARVLECLRRVLLCPRNQTLEIHLKVEMLWA